MIPVFNCFGINESPNREVLQEAGLHWGGHGMGREESPKCSRSAQAPDDLRGDENKIWILPRGLCYTLKGETGGLACTPSQILAAKLSVSILALVFMPILFVPLTTASSLLPSFFLSPPFPVLFTSLSPFPHRMNFIFKNNLNTSVSCTLEPHFILKKS